MTGSALPSITPTENSLPFMYCSITTSSSYLKASALAAAYSSALNLNAPSVLVLTRQDLEPLNSNFEGAKQGGYIIKEESKKLGTVLIATGSEVKTALEVAKELEESAGVGVRVVSMPCMELFDAQPESYKEKVLNSEVPTFSIELSSDLSFAKYIKTGEVIGTFSFGKSGVPTDVLKELKLDVKSIVNKIKKQIKTKETK